MLVEFGKAALLEKARQQPEKVRMVLDKVKTDGLFPTLAAVRSKLDQPLALGYCNVGTVIEVGPGVTGWRPGDRVASNGKHAEVVIVPTNLCAKVPDGVSDDEAVFTVLASIGLQGIRLLQPTLGEAVVVTGLGLIGLITLQLLKAHGCRVLGIDMDPTKIELARQFGAETVDLSRGEDPIAAAQVFSRGRGVDGVLIAASTKSSAPVHQAALMCRKRGRIVLVGVTGLELSRADFYEKELSFQVSCSYGPGRYDKEYEDKGNDYPVGLVRWTEQRNFEAVLDMIVDKRLDLVRLISHRIAVAEAHAAYDLITGTSQALGVVLTYDHAPRPEADQTTFSQTVRLRQTTSAARPAGPVLGVIGSGNYATQVLIPHLAKTSARLKSVASIAGVSGLHIGRKFGFEETTTDSQAVLGDSEINAVVIATRHDTHADFTCHALRAGKHVFVEKPLALSQDELDEIEAAYNEQILSGGSPIVMVGYNRRFAPHVLKMKSLVDSVQEPKVMIMTVNAGAIPPDHWTQDKIIGGGRIIGEACHFVDLLRFFAGGAIADVQVASIGAVAGIASKDDKTTFTMKFDDGSMGTIHYLANGHKSFPKERLEVFCSGRILQLDNYRKLTGFGWPKFKKMNLWRQDKGQAQCVRAFVNAIAAGKASPIPFGEILETTAVAFRIAELARA
jgi:predicted dehydrogenase/threonine dehydrogenase-like Zn-dependent dehydrogenase